MQDEVPLPFPQNLPRVPRGQDPAEMWVSTALGGCWLVRRRLHNHKTVGLLPVSERRRRPSRDSLGLFLGLGFSLLPF